MSVCHSCAANAAYEGKYYMYHQIFSVLCEITKYLTLLIMYCNIFIIIV